MTFKKLAITTTLFLLSFSLFAQEVDDIIFKVENDPAPFAPFSFGASYVDVQPAHLRRDGLTDHDLTFRQWESAFSYTLPCSNIWGLIFGAGWVGVEVDMQENPFFDEKVFNYVNMLVGGFTTSFPGWLWKCTLSAFLDLNELSLIDYALYQGVLWGKYDLCKWIELDFGFIAETGLHKTKIWPIIGFIYQPTDCWTFNLVFPTDVSINYAFNDCLSASASLRFLRTRHRLRENEINSQGIFEYHTTGAELDLYYTPFRWLNLKGFVGTTGDGDLKVGNRNDDHITHFKFKSSLYTGATLLLCF